MLLSRHRATDYRTALGAQDKTLIVLASTWGPRSLFGSHPDLAARLTTELPADEYQVCAIMHPGITSAHSPYQLNAWLSEAQRAGLRVVPPETGWQAAIMAASCVISDYGSLALYAAAMDCPLLLTGNGTSTVPGSPMAALTAQTARLDVDRALAPQLELAIRRHTPGDHNAIVKQAVGEPEVSAELLRPLVYRLLDLPEPATEPVLPPIDVPKYDRHTVPAFVVGAEDHGDTLVLRRFPSNGLRHDLDFRHLTADATHATLRQITAASIIHKGLSPDEGWRFDEWSAATLRQWPDARLVAASLGPRTCLVRTRTDQRLTLTMPDTRVDPLVLASLVYVRGAELSTVDRIRIGEHVIEVTVQVH